MEAIEKVDLPEGRGYEIHFRNLDDLVGLLEDLDVSNRKCIVVSDDNVAPIYLPRICETLTQVGTETLQIILPAGESTKSQQSLQIIYDRALNWGINRKTPLIALGGGVVGDVAAFAAATLLRGIPVVHAPTSLVSQVDSSIGGKTGINHSRGKNLIGSFYQPLLVLTDTDTLQTLPAREWTSGLAEVIKHALIADESFFYWIETNLEKIIQRDRSLIPDLVRRAAAIKCRVVSEDELESGLRMILNFGHTFGHALERLLGYGTLTHGEAVTIGMRAALVLSRRSGMNFELERADRVLSALPMPGLPPSIRIEELTRYMATDKKRTADSLNFVLLEKIGHAITTVNVEQENIDIAWRSVLPR